MFLESAIGREQKRPRSMLDFAGAGGTFQLMPTAFSFSNAVMRWDAPVPDLPARATIPAVTATAEGKAPAVRPSIKTTSKRLSPAAEDSASRTAALLKWQAVIAAFPRAFGVNDKLGTDFEASSLEDYFATRRTGPLGIHSSAWRLFLRYTEIKDLAADLITEAMIYDYLVHLKEVGAPATRGASFLRACNFAYGLCEFTEGAAIAQSARCKGAAAVSLRTKRLHLQRDPLLAKWLRAAEAEIVRVADGRGSLKETEAAVLGFFLFCSHTRSRCSDASRILCEPFLDEGDDSAPDVEQSFIQTAAAGELLKTGNTADKAKFNFPVVGLSFGISGLPWGRAWLELRRRVGLNAEADGCLQREPLRSGAFGHGHLGPGQATEWLRFLLIRLGVDSSLLSNIGSHSCKATLLSVAAKGGMTRDDRRALGGHAPPGDRSVDTYARDALAAPLRNLAILLSKVRCGLFDPDATRSGRWRLGPSVSAGSAEADPICPPCGEPLSSGSCFRCGCGNWVHSAPPCSQDCGWCGIEFCTACCAMESHKCQEPEDFVDSDDSLAGNLSDDDSDGDRAAMLDEEADAVDQAVLSASPDFLEKGVAVGVDAEFPSDGILVNRHGRFPGVAHRAIDGALCACGVTTGINMEFRSDDEALFGTNLCWRAGCAPWKAKAAANDDSDFEVVEDAAPVTPKAPSPEPTGSSA